MKKRRLRKAPESGVVHILSTFNNTIVTITDEKGNCLSWASAGSIGFKGSKKGTPYAAGICAKKVARGLADIGLRNVDVWVKGPGAGRDSAVRAIKAARLKITYIRDVTPIPHNGCRPPKKRRI
ncbi:30S ribosomal protein S11 [candidate division WOR-3 bacterium]|nr:30S ribosomal protein S11 [candidate division WOR-3 bacterium]MCK4329418.1 30S ribosomal protein S11 [candidate division WOR-3 bacterium]